MPPPRVRRASVCIITPYPARANNGNWHTAARWGRLLRPAFRVRIQQQWDGRRCDALIALHAGRSAASIKAFAHRHPSHALIVVLTGTDLYGNPNQTSRRSLDLATRLVVLNEQGINALPRELRAKCDLLLPSATPLAALAPRQRTFDVAVVGHLRAVKDPGLPMRIARRLPDASKIRFLHAGKALEREWSTAARITARSTNRYHWLGGVSAAEARTLIRRSRLLLHPSRGEGGATVIAEALQSGTPVIASDCDGNVGLLGTDYPGLFPTGNMEKAEILLLKAENEPRFYRQLTAASQRRARLFAPAREGRTLRRLVHNSIQLNPRSPK
ncbi:MAG: selenoneine biosynthesis selenosugar synthase SenB [Burkholderiaceae bacterium]